MSVIIVLCQLVFPSLAMLPLFSECRSTRSYSRMVLLELSIVPMGTGVSVSSEVAKCVALIEKSGLDFELHSMGTIVEGELHEVLAIVENCITLLAADHERVTCSAKIDYRRGATGRLKSKVTSVQDKLKSI